MSGRLETDLSQFQQNLADVRNKPEAHQRIRQASEAFGALTDPTPADYTDYWRERWEATGTILGVDFGVARCDRSAGEVQELHSQDRTLVVRPEEFTPDHLEDIHGGTTIWTQTGSGKIISEPRFGWLDIENSTEAPNLDTTVEDLLRIAKDSGRHGMTLITYFIGSLNNFDLTGVYFDGKPRTKSRLLGSKASDGGQEVRASLGRHNDFMVSSQIYPVKSHGTWGGRFEGVKRA